MPAGNAVDPRSRLKMEVSQSGREVVVKCGGLLTAETSSAFKERVKSLLPGAASLVIDLSDVTRMDSSGLGAVVGIYVSARGAKCGLELINFNRQIRDLLGMTNLLSVFESCGRHLTRLP